MRSIKLALSKQNTTSWDGAVLLISVYLSEELKANELLELLPESFSGRRRATCQSLFLGALRQGHRINAAAEPFLRKKPRELILAVLLVAGFEMLDSTQDKRQKIVHHAIERSKKLLKKHEIGFLNAVLRKLPDALADTSPKETPATYYSHPDWLYAHWTKEFGEHATRQLLAWNQQIPTTYIKLYDSSIVIPEGLEPTAWQGFYRLSSEADWREAILPLLNKGNAYIKDPSTRIAPGLLQAGKGESVLDLCAAPGGKAYDLAHSMQREGCLVAVDLPSKRIGRLSANLKNLKTDTFKCSILECDLLQLQASDFAKQQLPNVYDAVMLDAPCSNTGVIQRRTDVKWRIGKKDIVLCARLQLDLLKVASRYVKNGGRIVYSTCSIEQQENHDVVARFLNSHEGSAFQLETYELSMPWETGHDGAGAFLLSKQR